MAYESATQGTCVFDNASVILADDSEPQPDASLLILPEYGGQTSDRHGYICGPPELVVEVALSSEAYDLHAKRRDYEKYGVGEYLVLVLREQRAVWFVRDEDAFTEMSPSDDGLLRSRLFGGLWLDPHAMFAYDTKRVHEVLGQGLESDDHRRTVDRLGTA
jgi:Uma2 family endonuclease